MKLLSEFEDDPARGGLLRLEDAEDSSYLDVSLSGATIKGYTRRLNRLRQDLERQIRVNGGAFASIRDVDPLDEMMRRLMVGSIVEP